MKTETELRELVERLASQLALYARPEDAATHALIAEANHAEHLFVELSQLRRYCGCLEDRLDSQSLCMAQQEAGFCAATITGPDAQKVEHPTAGPRGHNSEWARLNFGQDAVDRMHLIRRELAELKRKNESLIGDYNELAERIEKMNTQ